MVLSASFSDCPLRSSLAIFIILSTAPGLFLRLVPSQRKTSDPHYLILHPNSLSRPLITAPLPPITRDIWFRCRDMVFSPVSSLCFSSRSAIHCERAYLAASTALSLQGDDLDVFFFHYLDFHAMSRCELIDTSTDFPTKAAMSFSGTFTNTHTLCELWKQSHQMSPWPLRSGLRCRH